MEIHQIMELKKNYWPQNWPERERTDTPMEYSSVLSENLRWGNAVERMQVASSLRLHCNQLKHVATSATSATVRIYLAGLHHG